MEDSLDFQSQLVLIGAAAILFGILWIMNQWELGRKCARGLFLAWLVVNIGYAAIYTLATIAMAINRVAN